MGVTPSDNSTSEGRHAPSPADSPDFDAIIERLGRDPGEYWLALEGLGRLEPEERESIIRELDRRRANPSAATLLRLLSLSRQPEIAELEGPRQSDDGTPLAFEPSGLVSCYVSPVDGEGRAMVALSARRNGRRATAAFLCDVRRGIQDVRGELELDSDQAGGLIEAIRPGDDAPGVANDLDLTLGLLAAGLELAGETAPPSVRAWIDRTVGPDFRPARFPALLGETEPAQASEAEIAVRSQEVLDACPTWFDDSPLTLELAGELLLRHGARPPDPLRDAGAYRYLFERRLLERLDLYRSMLLWMALLWARSGEGELAHSATLLAAQLLDEQFAVPSHPFVSALATRGLEHAQAGLIATSKARIPPRPR